MPENSLRELFGKCLYPQHDHHILRACYTTKRTRLLHWTLRNPLKNILRDGCDLPAVRISVAENNVKGHLLFSAALGQIEAMEAGTCPFEVTKVPSVEGAKGVLKHVLPC
jgi:hypothetical protein